MPISELMATGLQLMLLGMGIVFGFLVLLVVMLKLMSRLAARFPDAPAPTPAPVSAAPEPGATDATLIAVVSAAVTRYRVGRGGR